MFSLCFLVKVWENSKHSPAARVSTAFLVLPNFTRVNILNSMETRETFYIWYILHSTGCELYRRSPKFHTNVSKFGDSWRPSNPYSL